MSTIASAPGTHRSRRWIALIFIALAQLMVVLDATIVNIALPSAQRALRISVGDRQWVITAYTLAFGGLLLFGGRLGDLAGRKTTFLVGLVGFAGASALGGAAVNEVMLLSARALQGAFGALLAPSALSLLAVTFTGSRERAKAFGIYGAIAGGGAAVGFILGGVLTEYLNWRWALYVNVPIAAIGVAGGLVFVHDPVGRKRARLDVPGVLLVTAGLIALVYGFTRAESRGWHEYGVIGLFTAAGALLICFVVVESLTREPLLPLSVVLDRNRGGAYLAVGLAVIGMFGLFLFMTFYLQMVKGYSPVRAGLAFLPMTAGMIIGSTQIAARLMNQVPARALMVPGLLIAAAGTALLTRLHVDSAYAGSLLPAQLLLGVGLGMTFMPAMNLATVGVDPEHAGIASAMVNTSQQVGGSIGTALLNTIAATVTTTYLTAHATGPATPAVAAVALVHGFTVALWWAVGVLVLAAIAVAVLINVRGERRRPATASIEHERLPGTTAIREFAVVGAHAGHTGPGEDAAEPAPVPIPAPSPASMPSGPGPESPPPRRAGVLGHVRGAEGVPIRGAALTLIDLDGRQVGRAVAGGDGWYAVAAPGPGGYMLIAAAEGHHPLAATVAVGDEPLVRDLTLSGTSGLTGTVRGPAGASVTGAMVVVTDVHGDVVGSAETGGDGVFAFADLVAGAFVVAVSAAGHRPAAVPVQLDGQGTTRCDVELPAGARVHGTVRAAGDRLPLADARVTLVDAAGNVLATVTTGPDGAYLFHDLDPGPYTLIASGYPPVATAVVVDGAAESELGLTLGHPED